MYKVFNGVKYKYDNSNKYNVVWPSGLKGFLYAENEEDCREKIELARMDYRQITEGHEV